MQHFQRVEDICFAIQDGLDQFFGLTDTSCNWFRDHLCHRNVPASTASSAAMTPFSFWRFLQLSAVADTRCHCWFQHGPYTHFFPPFDEGFFCHVSVVIPVVHAVTATMSGLSDEAASLTASAFFRFFCCSYLLFCIEGCNDLIRSAGLRSLSATRFHSTGKSSKGCQVSVVCLS